MPFTQANSRFSTNVEKGHPHYPRNPKGSVFSGPVLTNPDGYTAWLEYVTDERGFSGWITEPLWLMWYDQDGGATISVSATFYRLALTTIGQHLIKAAQL